MKSTLKLRLSFILAIPLFILLSCKQPETVVVTENPTPSSSEPEEQQDTALQAASFKQLNIGETNRIPSLNPLFAENTSTLRSIQLVYEGLVRYDSSETVVPAVAKSWSVSSDSLTYEFILHNNIYYHDSDVFSNGTGRRLVASDVKYVFERMARNTVPGHAARLFMNIQGFEPFYREQHNVLYPKDRQLSGITGISIPNDSTVTFTLNSKDAHFLQKLASPYAVLYPREAVDDKNPAAFRPVGTGPFTLSRRQGESHFIFARYNNYHHRPEEPVLNRVDVIVYAEATALLNALQENEVHLIPQLDPTLMDSLLDSQDNLIGALNSRYRLGHVSGKTFYAIHHNPQSNLNRKTAFAVAQRIDFVSAFNHLPEQAIEIERPAESGGSSDRRLPAGTIKTTFTSDPFLKAVLQTIEDTLKRHDITLEMLDIRTPVEDTGLYTRTHIPQYPTDSWSPSQNTLIAFSATQPALYLASIDNLTFNRFPWWMNLRTTTLPGIDNLGRQP